MNKVFTYIDFTNDGFSAVSMRFEPDKKTLKATTSLLLLAGKNNVLRHIAKHLWSTRVRETMFRCSFMDAECWGRGQYGDKMRKHTQYYFDYIAKKYPDDEHVYLADNNECNRLKLYDIMTAKGARVVQVVNVCQPGPTEIDKIEALIKASNE